MADATDAGVGREAAVFPGSGEMAAICRAFDWAATPLGPVVSWPACLRTTVALLLAAPRPMILFWGPERVQLYNDAYVPALGAGRHPAALGARGAEFWAGAVWDIVGPQLDAVVATGVAAWHADAYIPLPRHGRVEDTYWSYSYSPVHDDAGRVAGVLDVAEETTARVLAERELRAAGAALAAERERLRALVLQMPAPVALLEGPEHRHVLVNDAYRRITRGGTDVTGLPLADAFPEVAGQGFFEHVDAVYATGVPWVARERLFRYDRDGTGVEDTWFDVRLEPVRAPGMDGAPGPVTGVLNTAVDVTDSVRARRAVEAALAASQAARTEAERDRARTRQLQEVTAALAGADTLDDVAGVIVGPMAAAVGARAGSLAVPTPGGDALRLVRTFGFPDAVVPAIREQRLDLASPIPACFRTGAPIWAERRDGPGGMDARYPAVVPAWEAVGAASGAYVPLVVAGATVGVIAYVFPETRAFAPAERAFLLALGQQAAVAVERARLWAAERAARAEAEAANRAKGEFLAVMSHELRTPLNAIGGYAELIELGIRGPVTAEQRTDLEKIQRAQRHLLGLINGVLNYAKVDAGAVHYELADVPLAEILATCEALVGPQVRARGLTLGVTPARDTPDRPLAVRADREKLQQVVLNLLSNAVKFTEPGGRVTLTSGEGRDAAGRAVVWVRVADTGIGIVADQLGRAFEPFVQVDARLTRTQEGTGLGLAISRDLARGMGGDLTAESTPGVGSTFTLTLPAT